MLPLVYKSRAKCPPPQNDRIQREFARRGSRHSPCVGTTGALAGIVSPVRILIDVVHPAQAHFFRPLVERLRARGHEILVASREKDCTVALLDAFRISHTPLTTAARGWGLAGEMVVRDWRLARLARQFRPDLMVGKESACVHQVAWAMGIASLAVDDTDDAVWQRRLSLPFASQVAADPGAGVARSVPVPGVSPLTYLHPKRFAPADPHDGILIRLVRWSASHDRGHTGIPAETLRDLIAELSKQGEVRLSSERRLPRDLRGLRLKLAPEKFHEWLSGCRLCVGESATLAAESAVLGVPSVYCSTRRLWYLDLLEARGLVAQVPPSECVATAVRASALSRADFLDRRDAYAAEVGDPLDRWIEAMENTVISNGSKRSRAGSD